MEDLENPEDLAEPTPDAFTRAAVPPVLFGAALSPYTRRRYAAAQAMGLLWPYIGEEGLRQYELTHQYPGMVKDAAIVCWLCSTPHASEPEGMKPGVFSVERAAMNPVSAFERCFTWAEEHGLFDPQDPRYAEAHAAFGRIVSAVEESRFEVEIDGERKGGVAGDPKPSAQPPRLSI